MNCIVLYSTRLGIIASSHPGSISNFRVAQVPSHPLLYLSLIMDANLLFVSPLPVGFAPSTSRSGVRVSAQRRRRLETVASIGRLGEFSSFDGDGNVQDMLVQELTLATRRLQSSQAMEQRIAHGMADVTETLNDLYRQGARQLEEQHDELARRAALPQVAQWNQALIAHSKQSAEARNAIIAELDDINKLLKRNKPRSRKRGVRRNSVGILGGAAVSVGFTVAMLDTFEHVAQRNNGPAVLGEIGGLSLLLVVAGVLNISRGENTNKMS